MTEQERLQWDELPHQLTDWAETQLGARIINADSQKGGFSRGAALRVVGENGQRAFLKAVDAAVYGQTARLYLAEARHLQLLPVNVPVAHHLATFTECNWVGLLLADIEGRHPDFAADTEDLVKVFHAFDEVSAIDASHFDIEQLRPSLEGEVRLWSKISELLSNNSITDASYSHVKSSAVRRQLLRYVTQLEISAHRYAEYVDEFLIPNLDGEQIVHTDVRADNILVTDTQAVIVDWAWMCRGNAAVDSALIVVDAVYAGTSLSVPDMVRQSRLLSAQPPHFVDALIVSMAGFYLYAALQEGEVGTTSNLPLVRAQRAVALLDWVNLHREEIGLAG